MESVGPPGWDESQQPGPAQGALPPPAAPARSSLGFLLVIVALGVVGAAGYLSFFAGSPEEDVEALVVRAITSKDPSKCDEVFTERWLAQHFSSSDSDPVARCEEATQTTPGTANARVESVAVSGDRADVSVEASGGNFGAGTFEIALVNDDGWRLDELTGIQVDRDRFLDAQRAVLAADTSMSSEGKALVACALDWAQRAVSATEIERDLLAGGQAFLAGSYESCESEVASAFFSASTIAADSGIPAAQAQCIASALASTFSSDERRRLFVATVSEVPVPADLTAARDRAIASCVSSGPGAPT